MIEQDIVAGTIQDGSIRYVVIRADVLMGIGEFLPAASQPAFHRALEDSAASHARTSFELYRRTRAPDLVDLLQTTVEMSGRLGWGRWSFSAVAEDSLELLVENSPFAAAVRTASGVACAPIVGVLRAMLSTQSGREFDVVEVGCASAGHPACTFRATLSSRDRS